MKDLLDIFEIWADLRSMAKSLGVSYEQVKKWRQRGRIPDTYWRAIIRKAALKHKTVTIEDLHRLNAPTNWS